PALEHQIEVLERSRRGGGGKAEAYRVRSAAGHVECVVRRSLGPAASGIDGAGVPCDQVIVEGVLHVRRGTGQSPEALAVGLVLGEDEVRFTVTQQDVGAEPWV